MEVPHVRAHDAGVIIGPDLTWADGRWTAHPDKSRDETLRHLPADVGSSPVSSPSVLVTARQYASSMNVAEGRTYLMVELTVQ
ncbi:hypothetical protein ACIOEW_32105 [Streptomyces sp. NPDC087901]|uniref:hypothetical protein n=1 Tax=Streptomyces sp. NPDC087901 TaxID=3365818 RepID=UPI00382A2BD2